MVDLTPILEKDPILDAADRALEAETMLEPQRPYLGMSSIGESCSRKLWYRFRWIRKEKFDAETLKRFADGHAGEAIIIERLSKVVAITHTGKSQLTYTDIDNHFAGHPDGIIEGVTKQPHIFEAKVCSEKKIAELRKAKIDVGQKNALKKWNPVYYAQAILYMFYEGLTRHYTVAATAGARDWISVRTDADDKAAKNLIEKARRIIYAQEPPDRISESPDWFECRYCFFNKICHEKECPDRTCRSCCHSTPIEGGKWSCALGRTELCEFHVFLPSLINGEVISTTATSVTYRMKDESIWKDGK